MIKGEENCAPINIQGRALWPGLSKRFIYLKFSRLTTYEVLACYLLAAMSGSILLGTHWLRIEQLPVIPCSFKIITNHPCPFCGVVHAFWAAGHGNWLEAIYFCPLGYGLYLANFSLFIWSLTNIFSGLKNGIGTELSLSRPGGRSIFLTPALLVAANWLYRLLMGFN